MLRNLLLDERQIDINDIYEISSSYAIYKCRWLLYSTFI